MDLGVPFVSSGDALFFQMLVKAALEHGWILANPDLGAPFGQELHDYPVAGADALHVLGIKALGLFSSNYAAVLNTYFLLSFPFAALSAFVVLRWLGISGVVAVAAAVLFALAPYHFLRGESHFFLAAYFQVPLGAYLTLAVALGTPLFARRTGGPRLLRYATSTTLVTAGCCLAVGLSDLYYVAFTVLLVAAATLLGTAARRETRTLLSGAAVTVALVVVTAVALTPNLLYRAEHGANPALTRVADDSEAFSLNLTGLVMPVPDHRVAGLASIRQRYGDATRVGREPAPLGVLAGAGFLWLLVVALALCLGAAGGVIGDARQRSLAVANLTAFLVGTTGGVSSVIAYGISPSLRTWSRLSIFIAFFALAALGLLADAAWSRFGGRLRFARPLALGALGVVVVVGVLDQTSPAFAPRASEVAAEYRNDEAFVREIESRMEPGASIFQLPYMRFPDELEFGRLQDYDHLRGYLHSSQLRWSYGAMKGREEDWQVSTANQSPTALIPMVSAAGFSGIYLDRFGYADNGAATQAELERILGVAPLASPNGRLAFFDMRPYNQRLRRTQPPARLRALAAVTLAPLRAIWSKDDFYPEEREGVLTTRWTVRPDSRLRVVNPSSEPRSAVLSVTLGRPGGDAATTVLGYPDGTSQEIRVRPEGTPVLRRVTFPPGESALEISTPATPVPAGAAGQGSRLVKLTGLQLIPEPALAVMTNPDET